MERINNDAPPAGVSCTATSLCASDTRFFDENQNWAGEIITSPASRFLSKLLIAPISVQPPWGPASKFELPENLQTVCFAARAPFESHRIYFSGLILTTSITVGRN